MKPTSLSEAEQATNEGGRANKLPARVNLLDLNQHPIGLARHEQDQERPVLPEPEANSVYSQVAEASAAIGAGISATIAWSATHSLVGTSKLALPVKLFNTCVSGGLTRAWLDANLKTAPRPGADHKAANDNFRQGAIDGLAAVAAFKSEKAFSKLWKERLASRANLGFSAELRLEQGQKILQADLGKTLCHNGLRGSVGGASAGFVLAVPSALLTNRDKLTTTDGVMNVSSEILTSTASGAMLGGTFGVGACAVWNANSLARSSQAALRGSCGSFKLDVHHFNDGHSALLGQGATLSRLATKASELAAISGKEGRPSILLDMGDAHSGTIVDVASDGGLLDGLLLNQILKVTASVPGNHAVDVSRPVKQSVQKWTDNLRLLASQKELPGVAANIELPLDPALTRTIPGATAPPIFKPYRIIEPVEGEKIGLVGLVTDELQAATPALIDKDVLALAPLAKQTWDQVMASKANLPADTRALLDRLSARKEFRSIAATDTRRVEQIADEFFASQAGKHKSGQAQQLHAQLIDLARRHPDQTIGDLHKLAGAESPLQELAKVLPAHRLTDLHEVTVKDPEKALQMAVAELKAQGVNKIIVMSHLGNTMDLELAGNTSSVAAIFGGHSHNIEPAPQWVRNLQGKEVPVSQAGSNYRWLGEANLVFNQDGSVNRFLSNGRLHHIHGGIEPDKEAEQMIQSFLCRSKEGQQLLDKVGKTLPASLPRELSIDGIRGNKGKQTLFANIITEAVKKEADSILAQRPDLQTAFGRQVEAVLIHSGGIRSGLSAGRLQQIELENIPLNNLCLAKMSGAQIERALNFGVHDLPSASSYAAKLTTATKELFSPNSKNRFGKAAAIFNEGEHDASGNFLLVDNLKYVIDRSLPPHRRVTQVLVKDNAGTFTPIDRAKSYTVLTETHPVEKWGKVPMISESERRALSFDSLPEAVWVHGKATTDPNAALANFKVVPLEQTATLTALAKTLSADQLSEQLANKHWRSTHLGRNAIKDRSPGTWRPVVQPSLTGIVVTPCLQAGKE